MQRCLHDPIRLSVLVGNPICDRRTDGHDVADVRFLAVVCSELVCLRSAVTLGHPVFTVHVYVYIGVVLL